jgi:hypothetical protein
VKLLPIVAAFVGGAMGWSIGKRIGMLADQQIGLFTGSVLAIVGLSLGFYYARRFQKNIMS